MPMISSSWCALSPPSGARPGSKTRASSRELDQLRTQSKPIYASRSLIYASGACYWALDLRHRPFDALQDRRRTSNTHSCARIVPSFSAALLELGEIFDFSLHRLPNRVLSSNRVARARNPTSPFDSATLKSPEPVLAVV
ncbi:hypothetical protein EXIGLDRAFT_846665 [Exidia glandulosa HHB12029]|uniref:Uncharacterized protein n=1 Tax=Exidia glandulosa HHB12029 TaxID=1314781 RepID=A0A166NLA9_EXIGL|nr:hypothetical protein EXIGLDRAFT_846665 [Exidia glandulosa HHB12029]